MTKYIPNYRIGNYEVHSDSKDVISGLSLRKESGQLEDRTFCFFNCGCEDHCKCDSTCDCIDYRCSCDENVPDCNCFANE